MITECLVIAIFTLWIYWLVQLYVFENKIKHIPGPKGYWIIGNVLDLLTLKHVIPSFSRFHKEFNGVFKYSVGLHPPAINVANYKLIEFILSSPKIITKSREYIYLNRWLGKGLLTSTGKKWQQRRKLLTPAFHFQILEQVVDVFTKATDILVEKLQQAVDKPAIDIFPYVTLCALDIISESAMGISINAQKEEDSEYVESVKEVGRIIIHRTTSPLKQFDFFYGFSKDYKKEMKALEVLHGVTDSVIKKRRKELESKGGVEVSSDDIGKKKKLAFLDLLLSATIDGQPLTDNDIREEVDTFMFEGHDTTSSAISFALYNLAKHPESQQKVVEELEHIFDGDFARNPTYKDLQEMKYLEMVIKESLRLYPPVPIVGRILEEDTEYDGKILPKGLQLTLFLYGMHRVPEFFPDPEKFDPERFSLDNKLEKKPYAYIPFSAGPRNCIGQKFAMLEMKGTICKIIQKFKLSVEPGFEPVLATELVLKSDNGIMLKLEKR